MTTPPVLSTTSAIDQQRQAKLVDGAEKFEAMLLQEMLKPFQFGEAPGADESTGGANETIRSMGVQAVAEGIAKGGGFGLSRQIIRQVNAEHEAGSTKKSQY
jgi:flagellar protein FlgJ